MRNPYSQMRIDARRSQKEIAQFTDNTEQYIRRLEHGLITTPDLRVAREIFDDLPSGYTNKILGELNKNMDVVDHEEYAKVCLEVGGRPNMDQALRIFEFYYKTWQRFVRRGTKEALSEAGMESPPVGAAPQDIRLWVLSYLVPSENMSEEFFSVRNFCTLISLHPSTWERWEKGHPKIQPSENIKSVLAEIGINLVDVG